MSTIVYLDDDKIQHLLMKKLMKMHLPDFSCESFEDPNELKDWLKINQVILILSDLNLERGSGWDLIPEFTQLSAAPIIFITGHASADDLEKSSQYSRVKGLFEKPLSKENWSFISELISSKK